MKRLVVSIIVVTVVYLPRPSDAQWTVYDPTNYAQAIARYAQIVKQYEFWVRQVRRLPADVLRRYRVPEVPWRTYPILPPAGGLDVINAALAKVPPSLQSRLAEQYAAIGATDALIRQGIAQATAIRNNGASMLQAIQALEDDTTSPVDDYHAQAALLNKINAASVVGLRIAERNTQFLANSLEQLLTDNARKRHAETRLMNAHLYQWQYGERYGADMFSVTAQKLDGWRQP